MKRNQLQIGADGKLARAFNAWLADPKNRALEINLKRAAFAVPTDSALSLSVVALLALIDAVKRLARAVLEDASNE